MRLVPVKRIQLEAPICIRARGVKLALEDAGDGIQAKWVQVAVEGDFLGYGGADHPGFTFTRATFVEVIANIHNHPSFHLGADGFGDEGIIPWDFSHASEQDPTRGSLAVTGAPAQGWSSDAQVRNGSDGKAQLWMLTKFGELARQFVKAGQYKWASVALSFESVDPESGDPTGALVTSIALTNTPFIEGMAQLAATTQGLPTPVQPDNKDAVRAAEEITMDNLKALAALLGVSATLEAVTAELESLTGLRNQLITLFAMAPNKATTTAILQTAADAHKGAETLYALCGALAVKGGTEAITSVAELQAASAELAKLKPEMLALQKIQQDAELIEVTADVDRALASNAAFTDDMRPMFVLSRTADKKAFLEKYPVGDVAAPTVVAPVAIAQLTQNVAATTTGVQLAVAPTEPVVAAPAVTVNPLTGAITRPAPAAVQAAAPVTGVLGGQAVNLSIYPGVTDTAKMVLHLKATRPGYGDLVWDDQFEAACLALAELKKVAA